MYSAREGRDEVTRMTCDRISWNLCEEGHGKIGSFSAEMCAIGGVTATDLFGNLSRILCQKLRTMTIGLMRSFVFLFCISLLFAFTSYDSTNDDDNEGDI